MRPHDPRLNRLADWLHDHALQAEPVAALSYLLGWLWLMQSPEATWWIAGLLALPLAIGIGLVVLALGLATVSLLRLMTRLNRHSAA